jgi:ABC-type glycerol-3-phosphate transport system substrate-binding protein
MKKIMTFAVVAGAALALSACGGKTEEAPAAEPTAEEMMMPEATPAADATDDAAAAAEGQEGTGNPIGPDVAAPEAGAE